MKSIKIMILTGMMTASCFGMQKSESTEPKVSPKLAAEISWVVSDVLFKPIEQLFEAPKEQPKLHKSRKDLLKLRIAQEKPFVGSQKKW